MPESRTIRPEGDGAIPAGSSVGLLDQQQVERGPSYIFTYCTNNNYYDRFSTVQSQKYHLLKQGPSKLSGAAELQDHVCTTRGIRNGHAWQYAERAGKCKSTSVERGSPLKPIRRANTWLKDWMPGQEIDFSPHKQPDCCKTY